MAEQILADMSMREKIENVLRERLATVYGLSVGGSDPVLADAVLAAMREPTGHRTGQNDECEGMMRAGLDAYHRYDSRNDPVMIVHAVWQAMIDKARSEA